MAAVPYNVNPKPQSGSGIFGSVAGPVAIPQPYQNFGQVFPNTQGVTTGVSNEIVDELSGKLDPSTLAQIQNEGAAFGIQSGMPGSGLVNNFDLNAVEQASTAQQQQGQKNYQSTIGPESRYLTVAPSTAAEIAETNAINSALPNPTAAGLANIGSKIAGMGFGYSLNNLGGQGSDISDPNALGVPYSTDSSQAGFEDFQNAGSDVSLGAGP